MIKEIKSFEERQEELIKKGEEKGFITYEEIAKALKGLELDPDNLDQLYNILQEKNIDVVIGRLPTIMADGSLVYDAIYYLVANSIKFSSKKRKAIIEIGCNQQEGKVVVFVKDNGIGFDMKYKDKIFEIFERLHSRDEYKGTGIGLSIVKRIITMHNGDVWVESEKGKGTAFYFTFE